MSDKEIRTMDRMHLLNVLRQLELEVEEKSKQIESLAAEKDEISKQLEDRRISMEKAGSLAEASIAVSGIIKAAQEAADVYLANIRRMEAEKMASASTVEAETKLKIDVMLQEAEKKRKDIEIEALMKADAIIKDAEQKRSSLEYEERKRIEELQAMSKQYMEFIDKAHLTMHDMIQKYKLLKLTKYSEPTIVANANAAPASAAPAVLPVSPAFVTYNNNNNNNTPNNDLPQENLNTSDK